MCYIHPGGVEVPDAALKLRKLTPKKYALHLIKSEVCVCMKRNLFSARSIPDCTENYYCNQFLLRWDVYSF